MRAHQPTDHIPTPSDRVSVLYVANAAEIGGGNRCLMDLIGGLDRSRFNPILVAPTNGRLVEWASREAVPCVIVRAGDWDGRVGLSRRTISLVATIKRFRARIVHAGAPTCFRAAGVAARLTGARSVCHLGYPPEPGELEWSFQAAPDVVIACHDGQAQYVEETVRASAPTARLVAVHYGIDVQRFTPRDRAAETPASHVRQPVVLIVGHLSEVKGYPTFFQAAARVVAAGHDCCFVALGGETASPGYGAVLERLVNSLGLADRVRFLGWRSDVEAVLQGADIWVLPSLAEGLPLALLEAMSSARPIITTPVGGIPEAIIDGANGLLVPPGDADALAAAIVKLLTDRQLAGQLGANARACAVARFSVARMASDIEEIYSNLLKRDTLAPTQVAVNGP